MNNRKNILSIVLVGTLLLLVSIILGIVINKQLEGPELCSSCHEMLPYYNSYINPPNGSILSSHKLSCLQCHANKRLDKARKDLIAEIIVYKMNISGQGFPLGELTPDCNVCHLPVSPVHNNLNQTKCTDCHWAHKPESVLKGINRSTHSVIPYGPHKNKTCSDCHGTNFEIPRCVKCHSGHGGQELDNSLCLACHLDPHIPKKPGILRNNTVIFKGNMPFSVCEPCHQSQFLNISNTQTGHTDMGTCTLCHQSHGQIPKCKKCHPGMMLERHPKSFNCKTCHATFEGGIRIICQDCHGTSHEWSALTAVINPK